MANKTVMCMIIHKNMLDVTVNIIRLLLFMSEKVYCYARIEIIAANISMIKVLVNGLLLPNTSVTNSFLKQLMFCMYCIECE
jgi:hypothetical protein